MVKCVRAARHYQRKDDQALALAVRSRPAIKRDIGQALRHLGTLVPSKALHFARSADWVAMKAHIEWGHARNVFKAVFARIGRTREAGAQLGARKINGAFAQARRQVRFRKVVGDGAIIFSPSFEDEKIDKYSEDQPRDDRGRWTSGGGGGAKEKEMSVGGKKVTVELSPASRAAGEQIVEVNTAAVERAWAKDTAFHVGPGGKGESAFSGRYHNFESYLASHDTIQAAEFGVQSDGRVGFTNGRHRFAVLRDMGATRIPVAMGRESIRNAERHGLLAKALVEKDIGDRFAFDAYDAATQARVRREQDRLITMLEDNARGAIDVIIAEAARSGAGPEDIVDYIRGLIGLNERQAQAVLNYETNLLDQGYDDDTVAGMVSDYIDRSLDYRAEMIARTESTRAANAGLHDAYSQAVERGALPSEAVTRHWQLGDSPCEICESIPDNEEDGVGVDDTFTSIDGEVDDPPVHPNCECSVEYVTNLDLVPE